MHEQKSSRTVEEKCVLDGDRGQVLRQGTRWVAKTASLATLVLLQGCVTSLQEDAELPSPQGWDYKILPHRASSAREESCFPSWFTFWVATMCVIPCVRYPGSAAQQEPTHAAIPRNPCPRTWGDGHKQKQEALSKHQEALLHYGDDKALAVAVLRFAESVFLIRISL